MSYIFTLKNFSNKIFLKNRSVIINSSLPKFTAYLSPLIFGFFIAFYWKIAQLTSIDPLLVNYYPKKIIYLIGATGALTTLAVFFIQIFFYYYLLVIAKKYTPVNKIITANSLMYLGATLTLIFFKSAPEKPIGLLIFFNIIFIIYLVFSKIYYKRKINSNLLFASCLALFLIPYGIPSLSQSGPVAIGAEDHFIQKAYLAALNYDVLLWDPWQSLGAHSYIFKATGYLNGHAYYDLLTWLLKPAMFLIPDFNYANYPLIRAYFWTWPRLVITFFGCMGVFLILKRILNLNNFACVIGGIAPLTTYLYWIEHRVPEEQLMYGGYSIIYLSILWALKNNKLFFLPAIILSCLGWFFHFQFSYNHPEHTFVFALSIVLFSVFYSLNSLSFKPLIILMVIGLFSLLACASYLLPAINAYQLLAVSVSTGSYVTTDHSSPFHAIAFIKSLFQSFSWVRAYFPLALDLPLKSIFTLIFLCGFFVALTNKLMKIKIISISIFEIRVFISLFLTALIIFLTCFDSDAYLNLRRLGGFLPVHYIARARNLINTIFYPLILGICIHYLITYLNHLYKNWWGEKKISIAYLSIPLVLFFIVVYTKYELASYTLMFLVLILQLLSIFSISKKNVLLISCIISLGTICSVYYKDLYKHIESARYLSSDIIRDHIKRFPEDIASKNWLNIRDNYNFKVHQHNFSWEPLIYELEQTTADSFSRYHVNIANETDPAYGFVLFDYPISNFSNQYRLFIDLDLPIFKPYHSFNTLKSDAPYLLPNASVLRMANINHVYTNATGKEPSNLSELIKNKVLIEIENHRYLGKARIFKVSNTLDRFFPCKSIQNINQSSKHSDAPDECIIEPLGSSTTSPLYPATGSIKPIKIFGNFAIFQNEKAIEMQKIISPSINLETSNTKGMFLYTDVYHEDWHAYFNQVEVPILLGNNSFKVMEVPNAQGMIWMEFRYKKFWLGILIATITFIFLGISILIYLRKLDAQSQSAMPNPC